MVPRVVPCFSVLGYAFWLRVLDVFITHEFGFSEAAKAFEVAATGKMGNIYPYTGKGG
jgi:hypothetical protein